jgi:hypothetical protein
VKFGSKIEFISHFMRDLLLMKKCIKKHARSHYSASFHLDQFEEKKHVFVVVLHTRVCIEIAENCVTARVDHVIRAFKMAASNIITRQII